MPKVNYYPRVMEKILSESVQSLPQVYVLYLGPLGRAPPVPMPCLDMPCYPVDKICRVCLDYQMLDLRLLITFTSALPLPAVENEFHAGLDGNYCSDKLCALVRVHGSRNFMNSYSHVLRIVGTKVDTTS